MTQTTKPSRASTRIRAASRKPTATIAASPKPKATMASSGFHWDKLPDAARKRIYHFLGYPTEEKHYITDGPASKELKPFRQIYKVDLTPDGNLSVPWNYDQSDKPRNPTPKVSTSLMCTNSAIRNELYDFLYGTSLFIVHLPNRKKPQIQALSECARSHIIHLVVNFNAIEATKDHFGVSSYPLALKEAVKAITPLAPSLKYFGITFWSPQLPRLFPAPDEITADDVVITSPKFGRAPKQEEDNFKDMNFLTGTLLNLIDSHETIVVFGLLKDMKQMGILNWGREANNIKRSIHRDLRNCMKKVTGELKTASGHRGQKREAVEGPKKSSGGRAKKKKRT